jgi:hypothetical protein
MIAMQVTGASCTRGSWDPFAPQPDLWAQKAGRLFLTSPALLTLEVSPPRMKTSRNTRTKHQRGTNQL